MIRFIVRTLILLAAAALGLGAAALAGVVSVSFVGFLWVVIIFAALQAVLGPFIVKQARRNAPALLSGVGLVTTLIALIVTSLIVGDGLVIDGIGNWLLAALIVWIVTMIGEFLLPVVLVKLGVERAAERRD